MFGTLCELILNNAFYPKVEKVYSNPLDKDGNPELSIVDNSGSADCFLNDHGYIANDFSLLMKAETESERQLILNRLVEVSMLPDSSGKSLDQLFNEIVPRGNRDPVDYEHYVDKVLDQAGRKFIEEQQAELEKQKIEFSKKDGQIIDNA